MPGDPRGFVDRKGETLRARIRNGDPDLHAYHKRTLLFPKVLLSPSARRTVREAVEGYCLFKQWRLLALNVRTNHVHVVVSGSDPSKMLNGVKARATKLLRDAGEFPADRPVCSERGNKHGLASTAAVADAVNYVRHKQGEDLPEA